MYLKRRAKVAEQWTLIVADTTSASRITAVLFAALIVSWASMYSQFGAYQAAAASRRRVDQQRVEFELARAQGRAFLAQRVRGRLFSLASNSDFPTDLRQQYRALANQVGSDPFTVLSKLSDAGVAGREDLALLTPVIDEAVRRLEGVERFALRQFQSRRETAADTPFKLLGLDFSVNGFWAWQVWLGFYVLGLIYLWLTRRTTFRRARFVWGQLAADRHEPRALTVAAPLWLRPLPRNEGWSVQLAGSVRSSLVHDPIGTVCSLLAFGGFALSLTVIHLGLISTSLLSSGAMSDTRAVAHAVVLSLLVGVEFAVAASWLTIPRDGGRSPENSVLVERRTVLTMAAACLGTGALYTPILRTPIRDSLLRHPRFRVLATPGSRKRRPKTHTTSKPPGFYTDETGRIHHVARTGFAKSVNEAARPSLRPYEGHFGEDDLEYVEPRALLAYVREGVRRRLKPFAYRCSSDEKSRLNKTPEARAAYDEAFALVQAAAERDAGWRQRNGRGANLQAYDLLAAIAFNGGRPDLLHQARELLARQPLPRDTRRLPARGAHFVPVDRDGAGCDTPSTSTPPSRLRAARRMAGFLIQRLGSDHPAVVGAAKAASVAVTGAVGGWWMRTSIPEFVPNHVRVVSQRKGERRKGRFHRASMANLRAPRSSSVKIPPTGGECAFESHSLGSQSSR